MQPPTYPSPDADRPRPESADPKGGAPAVGSASVPVSIASIPPPSRRDRWFVSLQHLLPQPVEGCSQVLPLFCQNPQAFDVSLRMPGRRPWTLDLFAGMKKLKGQDRKPVKNQARGF